MAVLHYNFHSHPKLIGLSNASVGIYARMLSYASANLTDGHVPAAFIRQISGKSTAFTALIEAGLCRKSPNGYQLHDYLQYNPSKEQVEEKRREARERARSRRSGVDGKNRTSSREQNEERTQKVRDIGKDKGSNELQDRSPKAGEADVGSAEVEDLGDGGILDELSSFRVRKAGLEVNGRTLDAAGVLGRATKGA